MNSKRGFVIPLIIAIVAILVIGGGVFVYENKKVEAPEINFPVIGGDKDVHGCLGPAGYSWCEVKNKCLRVWEEKCEVAPISTTADPVACTADAKQCPDGSYVGRSGPNCEFVCLEVIGCLKAGEAEVIGGIPTEDELKSIKPCCAGLSEVSIDIIEYEGQCLESVGSYGYRCAPCGNYICEANYGENKCTCSLDCK